MIGKIGNNQFVNFWTDKEKEFLKRNYLNMNNEELASNLNRPISSTIVKLGELKLRRTPYKYPFKEGEKIKLCACGCSNWIVYKKYHRLNIPNYIRGHMSKTSKNPRLGRKAWNTGLTKETDARIMNGINKSLKTKMEKCSMPRGEKHPLYGRTKENNEWAKRNSERMKLHNPMFNSEISKKTHEKIGKINKEKFKDLEYRESLIKKMSKGRDKRPTLPEKVMIEIIEKNNLPFNYVGDGKIWFRGEDMAFNPDFLSKNLRYIIEVFGNYWHNLPENINRDKVRLKTYIKHGYQVSIIWEHELIGNNRLTEKEILNKIESSIKIRI